MTTTTTVVSTTTVEADTARTTLETAVRADPVPVVRKTDQTPIAQRILVKTTTATADKL